MRNPNAGAAKRTTALAAPAHYFELTFQATANVPVPLVDPIEGGRATTGATTRSSCSSPAATSYAIGTTSAAEMNLEDCSGCGISGWGWQDNGWGIGVAGPHITFTTTGTQHDADPDP